MIAAFMVPQKRDFISRDDAKIAAWTILEGMGVSAKHNERLVEEVDAVVDDIPAADVRPVVRGKWQPWEQDRPPLKWYSCDYCGFHALSKSNYCPNCGADMREES